TAPTPTSATPPTRHARRHHSTLHPGLTRPQRNGPDATVRASRAVSASGRSRHRRRLLLAEIHVVNIVGMNLGLTDHADARRRARRTARSGHGAALRSPRLRVTDTDASGNVDDGVAGLDRRDIGAGSTVGGVVAGNSVVDAEDVVAGAAAHHVIARATGQGVVPTVAGECVVAGTPD